MKIAIITSAGLSGAGAISDYLLSREDFVSPFKKKVDYKQDYEFRILHDPFGIEHLYNSFYKNFSVNNAAYAFHQFCLYTKNLKNLKDVKTNKKIYSDNFFLELTKYTKKIIKLSYYGLPQHFRIQMKKMDRIKWRIQNFNNQKFAQDTNFYNMVIPVSEKEFLIHTKSFLKKIINLHNRSQKKNIVIDQGANFWNPESVNKYFDNSKVIQVIRDPKGVFSSMKTRKSLSYPGNNIKLFVKWFKETNLIERKIQGKKTLKIKFEQFIINHNTVKKKINKYLKIKNIKTNFDYIKTKKNLFNYKKKLSKEEINYINKNLKEYVYFDI
tara:strand:- start:10350 stop:11327 length:978 start_codon:yes stop_codon:yes gene_type:complete